MVMKMNKYRAKHIMTGREIEVEYLSLAEAVMSNAGFSDWDKL